MAERLRRVNPASMQDALTLMQQECLPGDVPTEYRPDDLWWVAYSGREPAGFCCIRPVPNHPGMWYMARAGVMPDYRGRGLQLRMLRTRIHAAKKAGATIIVSDCTAANSASANNLIRAGFRVYDPVYRWGLPSSIYWRLKC